MSREIHTTTRYGGAFITRLSPSPRKRFRVKVAAIAGRHFPTDFTLRVSCQYLHFAQTQDIWSKSAWEGKRGVLWITGSHLLFETREFFSLPARDPNGTLASLNFFSSPPCRAKKIPPETFLDDYPGKEAYNALKISRIYLPANFCHVQSISRRSSKLGNVPYCIRIFLSWFV